MDFFQRQEHARRNTFRLILLFAAGVSLMLVTVYAVAAGVFLNKRLEKGLDLWWWDPQLAAWVGLGTLAIIIGGSLFKIIELSGGGAVVASALGGEPVNAQTRDPDQRKLLNIVEEMSIASGVPMPEVYVMPEEDGINAFAAGTAPDNAVIGVTQGSIRHLSRDELQGVIAHEYSHILNGDMRLNLRLIGWVFGILCIMMIGRVLLESAWRGGSRRRSSRDNNPWPLMVIGLSLLAIGWLGAFFGRLIQAAVSRQREFLADASAVQFTRNPLGLAGALKKIGGYGSKLESAHAAEASHMFFCNGLNQAWFNFTATHPPLDQRIRLLDPSWDGQFPATGIGEAAHGVSPYLDDAVKAPVRPAPPIAAPQLRGVMEAALAAEALASRRLRDVDVVQHVGAASAAHLAFAGEFKASLPSSLTQACQEPLAASALVYGLLLNLTPENQAAALASARAVVDAPAQLELTRLAAALAAVDPRYRLTLVLMALPALRQMTPAQFQHFEATVRALAEADQELDLFEYALLKAIFRHLRPQFQPVRPASPQYYALGKLLPECGVLLSALAHVGNAEAPAIEQAFRAGASQLRDGARMVLQPLAACGLGEIDGALNRLAQTTPQIKRDLINACAHVVAADHFVHGREAELLRAIADTLDCPIPPFVAGV